MVQSKGKAYIVGGEYRQDNVQISYLVLNPDKGVEVLALKSEQFESARHASFQGYSATI